MRMRGREAAAMLALFGSIDAPNARGQTPAFEVVGSFRGHSQPVYAVALTPDGKKLVTGSLDATVRLWDVASGREENVFAAPAGHTKQVLALATHPEGRIVASAGGDGAIKFWDIPKPAAEWTWNDPVPRAVSLWGGPTWLAPYNLAGLVRTSETTFRKTATAAGFKAPPHPTTVHGLSFSPTSPNLMATAAADGRVRIIDLAKGVVLKEIVAHVAKDKTSPVYTVVFAPDGKTIASASYDQSIKIHDVAGGGLVREIKGHDPKESPHGHKDEVYALAYSSDGKRLASGSGGLERLVKIWNAETGQWIRDMANPTLSDPALPDEPASHPGWIYHVRFLSGGRLISLGDAPKNRGYLSVWNVDQGKLLHGKTTEFGSLLGLAIGPDESWAAVGCGVRSSVPGDFNHAHIIRVPR